MVLLAGIGGGEELRVTRLQGYKVYKVKKVEALKGISLFNNVIVLAFNPRQAATF